MSVGGATVMSQTRSTSTVLNLYRAKRSKSRSCTASTEEFSAKCKHREFVDRKLAAWVTGSSWRAAGQSGYDGHLSLVEHLFTLRVIVEQAKAKKEKLFCCFVDLKKAFPTVPRAQLWQKLEYQGVSGSTIEQIRNVYKDARPKLQFPPGLTADMVNSVGIVNGPLSPAVFALYINDLEGRLLRDGGTSPDLQGVLVPLLMYAADNLVLISRTAAGLRIHLKAFESYCQEGKLSVVGEMARVLVFGADRRWIKTQVFRFMGNQLEIPESLIYLGIPLHETKSWVWAVSWRATCGMKALREMFDGFVEREISNLKSAFDETVLMVLSYGCEAWAVGMSPGGWMKLEAVYQRFLQGCMECWTSYSHALRLAKFGEVRVPLEVLARMILFVRRLQCSDLQGLPQLAFETSKQSKVSGWYLDVTNWFRSWSISVTNLPTETGSALHQRLKTLYWTRVWTSPVNFPGKSIPLNLLRPSTTSLQEYQSENYMRRLCDRLSVIDAISTSGSICESDDDDKEHTPRAR